MALPTVPIEFPNALCNYPKHMYVDENVNRPIRCLATGCNHLFTDENSKDAQVMHYRQCEVDFSLSDICRNEHGLLKQLHTLRVCPLCKTVPLVGDFRYLCNHLNLQHQGEKDITTIKGFLITVRNNPENFPDITPYAPGHREETFKLVYEHAKLSLTSQNYRPAYRTFMGYRDDTIPEDDFRKFLTDQGNPVGYWPIRTNMFLVNLQHDRKRTGLNKGPWVELKFSFQQPYSKGDI